MQKTGRGKKTNKSKKQKLQSNMGSMVLSRYCKSHVWYHQKGWSSWRLMQGPHGDTCRGLTGTHMGSSQEHTQPKPSELGRVAPFFVTSPCQRSIFFCTRSDLAVKYLD